MSKNFAFEFSFERKSSSFSNAGKQYLNTVFIKQRLFQRTRSTREDNRNVIHDLAYSSEQNESTLFGYHSRICIWKL